MNLEPQPTTRTDEAVLLRAVTAVRDALDLGVNPVPIARRHAELNGVDALHVLDLALKAHAHCGRPEANQGATP